MSINDLSILQFIALSMLGYLVCTVVFSSIILFIADVCNVIKRKLRGV